MWAAVRQQTGRRHKDEVCDGITAETLNQHYARISTDSGYQRPPRKFTATHREVDFVSEWQLFSILDTLPPTATGLDHLLAWFIRLGAPVFSKTLAHLFNKSLSTPTVPLQWKYAFIQPVPKIASPLVHSDLRPISITSVLCRTLERIIVRQFLYPAIVAPLPLSPLQTNSHFVPQGPPPLRS